MGFCYWVIPKWVKPAIALFLLATGVLPLLASIPRAISGAECPGYVIEKEALGGVEGIDLRRYEAFPVAQMVRVPWVTRAPGGCSAHCHRHSSSASVSVPVRARESSSVCACMSKYVESIFSSSSSWKVPETKVEAHADGHRMYTHTDNLWQHGTPTHAKCLRAPFRLCHIAQ